jgi:hypothetical protein
MFNDVKKKQQLRRINPSKNFEKPCFINPQDLEMLDGQEDRKTTYGDSYNQFSCLGFVVLFSAHVREQAREVLKRKSAHS